MACAENELLIGPTITLAETGAMQITPNILAMRQMLGRRLLGAWPTE